MSPCNPEKNKYNSRIITDYKNMSNTQILRLITAILESILAIPVWGGIIIVSMAWIPLGIMLILHIVTLVFAVNNNSNFKGSVSGIIASILGWIPGVGFVLHLITAILLWIDFSQENDKWNKHIAG